ncbi:MAG TPA: undecaprenyldiphospho-muramoylpentapeptide beta-N-acetylglucosaminyltransferase [Thermoanaerobaculia bacterium]|jgi:UDP-N-acetylglucosamine--N-acetylmuramyl-(pentapeptide) pyrophosphoryl-undecaprenol N-acetylglucosamine transferase|nr:undecaprenyldiphospho-muramoylpentapeptide beta-N-acetylglucosaminyltransferase [Thermoanaerobaculia bacterium]
MAEPTTFTARLVDGLHVLLAGGGSGGHVFPALAVASALQKRGGRATFVGSPHGFEAKLVPERDIPFHALPAKPVLGRGPLDKARAGVTLLSSAWRARGLAKELRPNAVLGTGGYASAAPVLGARLAGCPVVLLEPNADPGSANRALSRFAEGACVAFREAGARLRCRTWTTGVPVREELFAIAAQLPPGPELRLLVLGGSQGSLQLNELVPAAVGKLALPAGKSLRVVHQCGKAHVEATRAAWQVAGVAVGTDERVEVLPFVDDVPGALAAAHLVVSRAGAITLAELCAAGRPSILVPLSIAAGHQQSNAEAMQRAGAARVLAGTEATPDRLAAVLSELFAGADAAQLATLQRMADAARGLARPGAADAIVDRLAEVAR